jgi:hypothetical protein
MAQEIIPIPLADLVKKTNIADTDLILIGLPDGSSSYAITYKDLKILLSAISGANLSTADLAQTDQKRLYAIKDQLNFDRPGVGVPTDARLQVGDSTELQGSVNTDIWAGNSPILRLIGSMVSAGELRFLNLREKNLNSQSYKVLVIDSENGDVRVGGVEGAGGSDNLATANLQQTETERNYTLTRGGVLKFLVSTYNTPLITMDNSVGTTISSADTGDSNHVSATPSGVDILNSNMDDSIFTKFLATLNDITMWCADSAVAGMTEFKMWLGNIRLMVSNQGTGKFKEINLTPDNLKIRGLEDEIPPAIPNQNLVIDHEGNVFKGLAGEVVDTNIGNTDQVLTTNRTVNISDKIITFTSNEDNKYGTITFDKDGANLTAERDLNYSLASFNPNNNVLITTLKDASHSTVVATDQDFAIIVVTDNINNTKSSIIVNENSVELICKEGVEASNDYTVKLTKNGLQFLIQEQLLVNKYPKLDENGIMVFLTLAELKAELGIV